MVTKGPLLLVLTIILALLVSNDLHGSAGTLDSLIQLARQQNPELAAARYRAEAADFESVAGGRLPDPQLSAAAVNLPRSSFAFDKTPMSGVVVGLTQRIPWPGQLSAERSIAREQAQALGSAAQADENAIVRLVKHEYFNYSYWTRARAIVEDNLELAQAVEDVATTRYSTGASSAQNVLRAQTLVARLEDRIARIEQMRYSALFKLSRLTDDSTVVDTSLPAWLPEQFRIGAARSSWNLALEHNPSLEAAFYQVEAASSRLDLAKSTYWPDLIVGVDYRLRRDVPMDPVGGEDFFSFRVGLTLPIWAAGKQRNQTRAASRQLQAERQREQALRIRLAERLSDIERALQTITESLDRYNNTIVPQAQAAWEAAEVAYEVGRLDFEGLLASQRELLEVELEKLALVRDYNQKYAELIELTGNAIER
jgi:outer membrane protein TolC